MALIRDIRKQTQRTNGTRLLSQIKYIARHHSASTDGDFFTFWKYWNGSKGWGTGGYHEIILRDGSVQLCYDPQEITNGVGGHNSYTYHICVVGNGSFTAAQEKAFKERCLYNMDRLNVPVSHVLGHREFSGASTACPGINMNTVRKNLRFVVTPASVDRNYLMEDDTGIKVKRLQSDLNAAGFALTVDGSFGPATKEAVLKFQLRTNLERDGIAGPSTLAKLAEVISRQEPKVLPLGPEKEVVEVAEEYKKDAQPSKSLATEFNKAVALGITDGTYPQRGATREEAAVMVLRAAELLNKK